MFAAIYLFPVRRERVEEFLRVQAAARGVYLEHGCLDDATYAASDLAPKYGCASFADGIPLDPGEELFVGVSSFRDRAHHDEVMARVDADERIAALYDEVTKLFDIARVVRGEFERRL
jgi:uncharacterized protein YbaA (DUF1428 family)